MRDVKYSSKHTQNIFGFFDTSTLFSHTRSLIRGADRDQIGLQKVPDLKPGSTKIRSWDNVLTKVLKTLEDSNVLLIGRL